MASVVRDRRIHAGKFKRMHGPYCVAIKNRVVLRICFYPLDSNPRWRSHYQLSLSTVSRCLSIRSWSL